MKYKIGFIGSGNMAFALIKAIKNSELDADIISSDRNQERLDLVKEKAGTKVSLDNKEVISGSDIIFIAVKPQAIDGVLDELKETDKIVVSIAAGISLDHLQEKMPEARVFRVMPNTPCLRLSK